MAKITVTCKTSAGYHPGLNINIVEGETHTIDDSQFADQLFSRPSPDWLAPWERSMEDSPEAVPATKNGGKKL